MAVTLPTAQYKYHRKGRVLTVVSIQIITLVTTKKSNDNYHLN